MDKGDILIKPRDGPTEGQILSAHYITMMKEEGS